MANRIIRHYWDENVSASPMPPLPQEQEPDKSKSISDLSLKELYKMSDRLRIEREIQNIISQIRFNSGERETYENPFKIDTQTPINQLYHFGILGQKWGVRRFQNKDGTRTPAGKRREREQEGINPSDDHLQSLIDRGNATKGLSNAELKRLNERLQLEKSYRDLTKDETKKGESFMKTVGKEILKQSLITAGTGALVGIAKIYTDKIIEKLKDKPKV